MEHLDTARVVAAADLGIDLHEPLSQAHQSRLDRLAVPQVLVAQGYLTIESGHRAAQRARRRTAGAADVPPFAPREDVAPALDVVHFVAATRCPLDQFTFTVATTGLTPPRKLLRLLRLRRLVRSTRLAQGADPALLVTTSSANGCLELVAGEMLDTHRACHVSEGGAVGRRDAGPSWRPDAIRCVARSRAKMIRVET